MPWKVHLQENSKSKYREIRAYYVWDHAWWCSFVQHLVFAFPNNSIYSAKYQTHPWVEVVYYFVHGSQFTCSFRDDLDNIWHMI
jgi:hypothetical protein